MSLNDANSQLDFGYNHKMTVCCHCRPDILNSQTPRGVGSCYNLSAPDSANLAPVDNTDQSYAGWNRAMQAGSGHGVYRPRHQRISSPGCCLGSVVGGPARARAAHSLLTRSSLGRLRPCAVRLLSCRPTGPWSPGTLVLCKLRQALGARSRGVSIRVVPRLA